MDGPSLPRSIRWRLQLGVFSLPKQQQQQQQDGCGDNNNNKKYTWSQLWSQNSQTCQELRVDYTRLQQEWLEFYEKQQQKKDDDDDEDVNNNNNKNNNNNNNDDDDYVQLSSSSSAVDIDPLTAMLEIKTAQEERKEQLELKFKKEKALRKRGIYNDTNNNDSSTTTTNSDNNTNNGSSSSQNPFMMEHEYSSFSSSWSLIEKDLHRLPRDHHEYYYKLLCLRLQKKKKNKTTTTKKPPPPLEYAVAVQERTIRLTEMLQIYARQHPHIGYRQGMHELISYCLLVVEMDFYQYEKQKQQQSQTTTTENNTNAPTTTTTTRQRNNINNTNTTKYYWNDDKVVEDFWNGDYVAHDAYGMFQVLMDPLAPAYDVNPTAISQEPPLLLHTNTNNTAITGSSCIFMNSSETRGQAILELIRTIASDEVLYHHLVDLQCPPELYTTRWIRLLFSREVQGNQNVLLLWDVFLDLWSSSDASVSSLHPSRYTRPGVSPPLQLGHWNLLEILETTAASMILLQRSSLLQQQQEQQQSGDYYSCDASHSDSIHRLMNIPPLKNILPLTATVLSMMRRRQVYEPPTTTTTTTANNNNTAKNDKASLERASSSASSRRSQIMMMSSSNNNTNNYSQRNVFSEMADAVDKFSSLWGSTTTTTTNNLENGQQQAQARSRTTRRRSSRSPPFRNNKVSNYPAALQQQKTISAETTTTKQQQRRTPSINTALNTTIQEKATTNETTRRRSTDAVDNNKNNDDDDLDQKLHGDTNSSTTATTTHGNTATHSSSSGSSSSSSRRSLTTRSRAAEQQQRDVVLASQLNDAVFTVKQFLLQTEIRSDCDDNLVPTSVWSALEQMESVQKELRQTPNSSTMRGNEF